MNQLLLHAQWHHSKKKAELIKENVTLIEMEFKRKATHVTIGKRELAITSYGFWCPKIMITENDRVIALQKHLGFWSTKSEFVLDGQTYSAKTKQGVLFNITYSNMNTDILTYQFNIVKNKPVINFEIKSFDIPEKQLLILLALGFYSIRNVAVEESANDFIVTSVA